MYVTLSVLQGTAKCIGRRLTRGFFSILFDIKSTDLFKSVPTFLFHTVNVNARII